MKLSSVEQLLWASSYWHYRIVSLISKIKRSFKVNKQDNLTKESVLLLSKIKGKK